MDDQENGLVAEDEHDIVEFSDDEGNTLLLEVMDYFFYNGDEYAVLMDADQEDEENVPEDEEEQSMYIMRVINSTSEDGEEMEEFVPVEDELLDQLVEIVQTRFADDDIVLGDSDEDEDEGDDPDEDDAYDEDEFEEEDEEEGDE